MKKEPSIHITESRLAEILIEVFNLGDIDMSVVNTILIRAKKYQLSNRKLLASNDRQRKKSNNIKRSPLEDAMAMAKVIYYQRKALKHNGIEIAKPGTRDFTIIKTITEYALQFQEEFGLPTKEGAFVNYVETYIESLDKGKNFNLIALQNRYQQISDTFKALQEIAHDKNKDFTRRAYESYNHHVINQIGELLVDYKKMPDKYIYFVKVAEECVRIKIEPVFWIKAQFKGLEWLKGIPEPNQLIGPKALERMQKYLYEFGEAVEESSEDKVKDLKNLKKLGHGRNRGNK
jgi:hypothetical protein